MSLPQKWKHWSIRNKLYHIPFWIVFHYLWWSVIIANPIRAANDLFFSPILLVFVFYVFFQAANVYFNLYYLLPKYLGKGKPIRYIVLSVAGILITNLIITGSYYLLAWLRGVSLQEYFGADACFFFFFGKALTSTFANTALAICIKLAKNSIEARRRQERLDKENLETELKFLKHQFNPHFLFNTINSIFFLINKNPQQASNTLVQFSDILRHHLYDCDDQIIPVEKELAYIGSYINLERLRLNDSFQIYTKIEYSKMENLFIRPFILMPFIENAFKHVSRAGVNDWIDISIAAADGRLQLSVSNSIETADEKREPGLGLVHVQRRLELLYNGLYDLKVEKQEQQYIAVLELGLDRSPVIIETPEIQAAI